MDQIFKFRDRKKGRFLLAPTHEEEITSLVASTVKSYRDLPLRLYQICMLHYLSFQQRLTNAQDSSQVPR